MDSEKEFSKPVTREVAPIGAALTWSDPILVAQMEGFRCWSPADVGASSNLASAYEIDRRTAADPSVARIAFGHVPRSVQQLSNCHDALGSIGP